MARDCTSVADNFLLWWRSDQAAIVERTHGRRRSPRAQRRVAHLLDGSYTVLLLDAGDLRRATVCCRHRRAPGRSPRVATVGAVHGPVPRRQPAARRRRLAPGASRPASGQSAKPADSPAAAARPTPAAVEPARPRPEVRPPVPESKPREAGRARRRASVALTDRERAGARRASASRWPAPRWSSAASRRARTPTAPSSSSSVPPDALAARQDARASRRSGSRRPRARSKWSCGRRRSRPPTSPTTAWAIAGSAPACWTSPPAPS